MAADRATVETVLGLIPHQPPFRFIDDILSLDTDGIVGTYRFRKDESFYPGHFPGKPVTPGVILVETMAQTGVVAYGIYLLMAGGMDISEIKRLVTLFSFADSMEFMGLVQPGEKMIIRAQKVYFRRMNLKVRATMERENGEIVCSGVVAGMAVKMEV